MRTLYHVSLESNFESIMENGLIPQIGERCEEIGDESAVYLFPNESDMNNALLNWLGEWYIDNYGEEIGLVALKVSLPDNFPIYEGEVGFEVLSHHVIPPEFIQFFREE